MLDMYSGIDFDHHNVHPQNVGVASIESTVPHSLVPQGSGESPLYFCIPTVPLGTEVCRYVGISAWEDIRMIFLSSGVYSLLMVLSVL